MKYLLFAFIVFLPVSLLAGNDGSHGGDPDAVEFVFYAEQACEWFKASDVAPKIDFDSCIELTEKWKENLSKNIRPPLVSTIDSPLTGGCLLKAACYNSVEKTVVITRKRWDTFPDYKKFTTAAIEMSGMFGSDSRYSLGELALAYYLKTHPTNALSPVVVHVPQSMNASASLQVLGEVGAGQSNEVGSAKCKVDPYYGLLPFGCDWKNVTTQTLNSVKAIRPGYYQLCFSGSCIFVNIPPNQRTIVHLRKLMVAPSANPVKFSVFLDITDKGMLDLASKAILTDSAYEEYCGTNVYWNHRQDMEACGAFFKNDPKALLNKVIEVSTANEYFNIWDFEATREKKAHRFDDTTPVQNSAFTTYYSLAVSDPTSGDFVSVFPGVYKINFYDPATQKWETKTGVKVR